MNSGLAAMVGRPDLASNYAVYMAAPVTGNMSQPSVSGGSALLSGSLTNTVSGNIGTGQMSLGMAGALVLLIILLYMWTHGHQH
jgi:hypothetical protein